MHDETHETHEEMSIMSRSTVYGYYSCSTVLQATQLNAGVDDEATQPNLNPAYA